MASGDRKLRCNYKSWHWKSAPLARMAAVVWLPSGLVAFNLRPNSLSRFTFLKNERIACVQTHLLRLPQCAVLSFARLPKTYFGYCELCTRIMDFHMRFHNPWLKWKLSTFRQMNFALTTPSAMYQSENADVAQLLLRPICRIDGIHCVGVPPRSTHRYYNYVNFIPTRLQ